MIQRFRNKDRKSDVAFIISNIAWILSGGVIIESIKNRNKKSDVEKEIHDEYVEMMEQAYKKSMSSLP